MNCFPLVRSYCYHAKKDSTRNTTPQKRLCVDNYASNSLVPLVVKAHSKVQGVLSLVPTKIDKLHTMPNGSMVYSSVACISGYHHTVLYPEAQKKSAFVTPISNFKFEKVLFGLAQAPIHFQQLKNEVS